MGQEISVQLEARLAAGIAERLIGCGRAALPAEACGLWIGRRTPRGWFVERALDSPNLAPQPRSAFRVDPVFQLRAEREAAARGWQVLGSWHSHPAGSPRPSARDLAGARLGDLLGIVAVEPAGHAHLGLWTPGPREPLPVHCSAQGACR